MRAEPRQDLGSATDSGSPTPLVKSAKTVWKFSLEATDYQEIEIPQGAQFLSVQTQAGLPQLWALVDPEAMPVNQSFYTHGTGHTVSDRVSWYLGSYQLLDGSLVFHVFFGAEQPPAAERTKDGRSGGGR